MMFSYPFFNFPNRMRYGSYPYGYSNYNKYSPYYYGKYSKSSDGYVSKEYSSNCSGCNDNAFSNGASFACENNKTENCCSSSNSCVSDELLEDRQCFEIMGIKLYFDDILLICLIFFLYLEGVQDEMLFLALVLLLLS